MQYKKDLVNEYVTNLLKLMYMRNISEQNVYSTLKSNFQENFLISNIITMQSETQCL